MKPRRQDNNSELHFGFFFPTGKTNHLYSDEAARTRPAMNKKNVLELASAAEEVGFDSMFIADNWSGHQRAAERSGHQSPAYNAPLLAMALLAGTERIGVISSYHTTFYTPAHVARMGATLDHFGEGRWGWNVVTGFSADEAALFGQEFVEHDTRYKMATEFIEVVRRLWAEEEPIDHEGEFFTTKGRIKLPRPVQDVPYTVSAGASPAGMGFASQYCDELIMLARTEAEVNTVSDKFSLMTAQTQRHVGVSPFGLAIVREGEGEAEEVYNNLLESLNPEATMEIAGDILGSIESAKELFAGVDADKVTRQFGGGGHVMQLLGTSEQVAEKLISLKKNTDASTLLINFPLWSPEELRSFQPVLKHLRDAGVWSPPETRDYSW